MPYGLDTPLAPRGLSGAYGLDTPVVPVRPIESSAGELERGIHRGLSTIANTGQAALGQVIQPFAPEFGTEMITGAIDDNAAMAQQFSPAMATWDDVGGLNDALLYGAGKFGEMAPLMPLGMGAAGVGRIAGGVAGSELGAAGAFLPLNVGDQAMQLQQDPAAAGMTPAEKLGHAGVVGGIQSLLEGAVPAGAVNRYAKPHTVPRSVSALGRGLAVDTVKGIGAGAAEEGLQEAISQAGKFSYNPAAEYNADDIKEAMIGGGFGIAPMAGAHAVAAHINDAAAGGGGLIRKGAAPVGDALGAGAKAVGEKIYNGLGDARDAVVDYATKFKDESYDSESDIPTNIGRAASHAGSEFERVVKEVADATLSKGEELSGDLHHAMRSDESRLLKTINDFANPPSTEEQINRWAKTLPERENFFRTMSERYEPNSRDGRAMVQAADAIAAMSASENMTPEQIQEAQGKVMAAATKLREALGGEKLKADRIAVSKWLNTKPDVKYSRMTDGATQYDLKKSMQTDTQDNALRDALDHSFKAIGWKGAEYAGERAHMEHLVRSFANRVVSGLVAEPKGIRTMFRNVLESTFGDHTGRLEAAIFKIIQTAKEDGADGITKGSEDVYDFVKSKITSKDPAAFTRILRLTKESDEHMARFENSPGMRIADLPGDFRTLVQDRIDLQEKYGTPPKSVQKLAMDVLQQYTDEKLRSMLKGSPDEVVQRLREMRAVTSDEIKRDMSIKGHDENRLNASESGFEEDGFGDGKEIAENQTALSTTGSDITSADVHDTDLPTSGHTTHEHGIGGETGYLMQLARTKSAPHSTARANGSKPARSDGSGHVEVGKINVLEHVRNTTEPGAQDAQLARWHDGLVAKAFETEQKISADLASRGIDPNDALSNLEEKYNRSKVQQEIAKANGAPWEVFDAVKLLRKEFGDDAQKISDLFWARVKTEYTGTPREFFEKFSHSFVTTRNNAGSHERLDSHDIEKSKVTSRQAGKRGITEFTHAEGYASVIDNNGETQQHDIPKAMEHSLGKVRTRDEGLDELGNREVYDKNLHMPDGSVNERYATDLRSAFANMAMSMLDSKEHTIPPETAAMLRDPPADLLLVRGKAGKNGRRTGDIAWGDLADTSKKVELTEEQHNEIILTEKQPTGVKSLSKGIMDGGSRPITSGGEPVAIDVQALIRHTAKALGVDMAGAPRQLFFAMLNEGVRSLHAQGVIDKSSLPMPVRESNGTFTLNPQYHGLVIGDRTYRDAEGNLVSKTEETQLKLGGNTPEFLKALEGASRLDADATVRSIAGLAGFISALEIQLKNRATTPTPTLRLKIESLTKELSAEVKAQAERVSKGFAANDDASHAFHTEIARLSDEAVKLGISLNEHATATPAEVRRLSKDESEAFARDGKQKNREDLDTASNAELLAKLNNVYEKMYDLMGLGDDVNVPDDGATGRHEIVVNKIDTLTNADPNDGPVQPWGQKIETRTKTSDLPQMKADVELDSRGNMVDPTIKADEKVKAVLAKKQSISTSDRNNRFEGRGENEIAGTTAQKADPKLQSFLDDIKEGMRPDASNLEDHKLKAFYDETSKLPDSRAKEKALEQLERMAAESNVNLATGQYRGGEEVQVAKPVLYGDGVAAGAAEAKLGPKGGLELWQGGKLVGKMLDPKIATALKNGQEVVARIARNGKGFEAQVSYRGESKVMPEYKGADNTPVKGAPNTVPASRRGTMEAAKTQAVTTLFGYDTGRVDIDGNPIIKDIVKNSPNAKTKYSRLVMRDGRAFDATDAQQIEDHFNSLFNAKVGKVKSRLVDELGNLVAGKHTADPKSPLGFMVEMSRQFRSGAGSTSMHEALHGLFTVLNRTPEGVAHIEKLQRSLTGAVVKERLSRLLDKLDLHPEERAAIDKDINDSPEEAAAYAFQFWATGDLKLGPNGDGFFAKVGKFIRSLIGVTREYERSEAFFNAFLKGDLGKADFKTSALERAFAEQKGDQMLKTIGEHLKPFKQVMNTVFDNSMQAMERLNIPEATELMRKYTGYGTGEGYIKRVNMESRIHSTEAGKIIDAYREKPGELEAGIQEVYAGDVKTQAGKDIMAFVDRMNAYAGRPVGTVPTIFDHAKITKDRAAFDAAIEDFGTKKEGIKSKAVLDLIGDLGFQMREGDKVDFLPQYANEKAKWMQTDPTMFMRSLIVSSVKATEHKKLFPNGRRDIDLALSKIEQKGGKEAYHKAKDFVDGMEGRLGQNMNPAVRNTMKAILTAGNIVTLPLSVFSAAVDPFHLSARSNTLGDASKAYAKGVGSIFKTVGELFGRRGETTPEERFAEEIGAVEHAMMVDVLGDTYLGDQAEGATKKINDWFFKANMLDGWTRAMRVAATTSAQRFIKDHSGANGKESMSKHSERFMKELGLEASDVAVGEDGNLVINDKIKMALNKFVDESVVRPDQSTNAIWMNDPRFMLLAHMKRFTYAFNDVVLARAMKEVHQGNMTPLAMLGASIPAILVADMGKHFLRGNYDTWMKGSTFGQWLDLGMNRAGINGKLQFGMDAVHDVEMGGTPIDSFMGPDIGMVKKAFGTPHAAMAGTDTGLLGLADDAEMVAYLAAGLEDGRQEKHKPAPAQTARAAAPEPEPRRPVQGGKTTVFAKRR